MLVRTALEISDAEGAEHGLRGQLAAQHTLKPRSEIGDYILNLPLV